MAKLNDPSNNMNSKKNINMAFWILAGLCILTFIPYLGLTLFNTKGEPREAIVAVSMLEYGDWILPKSCGGDMPYKPPFLAWLIAIFSAIQGHVSEFTSRLPSALALIAMTLVGFRYLARRTDVTTALIATVITMTTFEVERAAMACRVDMVLTAFIVMSIYSLHRHYEKLAPFEFKFPWGAILLLSCGVLTKGPVAAILPCLVVALFTWLRGHRFEWAFADFFMIGMMSFVIPAIWYVAAYLQGGDDFLHLVIEENFGRFTGSMSYESHANPIYYNFITVIAGYLPYTLLALMALFTVKWRREPSLAELEDAEYGWKPNLKDHIIMGFYRLRGMKPVDLLSLVAIVVIFVFYCIPESKRSVYLLPIYPFIGYFMARMLVILARRKSKVLKCFGSTIAVVSILVAAAFVAIRMNLVPTDIFSGRHAQQNIAMLQALATNDVGWKWLFWGIALWCAIAYFGIQRKNRPLHTIAATLVTIVTLYWSLYAIYQPAVLNTKSDLPLAKQIEAAVPEGKIYSYVGVPMLRFYTANFYLNDRIKIIPYNDDHSVLTLFLKIKLIDGMMPKSGHILIGDYDVKAFKEKYQYLSLTPVFNYPRRSCDIGQSVTLYRYKVVIPSPQIPPLEQRLRRWDCSKKILLR